MNWITLRKSNIHLVDLQVERVIAIHNQIRKSVLQGDILSVQKMSNLEISVPIKKRIQEMDDFYNHNCLDERVRNLQVAKMKLIRLINSSILVSKDEDLMVNISRKNKKDISTSKISNPNLKKNANHLKTQNSKDQKNNNFIHNQINKSPKSYSPIQRANKQTINSKKPNITLQIPNQIYGKNFLFSGQKIQQKKHNYQQKTSRKSQIIPIKNPNSKQNNNQLNSSQLQYRQQQHQKNNYKIKITQPTTSPQQNSTSRSKVTNLSSLTRTLTQNDNGKSMKKLNDLIFSIKMTKQEYQDFMEIKNKLNYH